MVVVLGEGSTNATPRQVPRGELESYSLWFGAQGANPEGTRIWKGRESLPTGPPAASVQFFTFGALGRLHWVSALLRQ
jgi:hypothetical protein